MAGRAWPRPRGNGPAIATDVAVAAGAAARANVGSSLGDLGTWLGSNSSGGKSWGEGLSNGLQNAMHGRALDQQRAAHDQTILALMNHGIDAGTARAAAGNATMLR